MVRPAPGADPLIVSIPGVTEQAGINSVSPSPLGTGADVVEDAAAPASGSAEQDALGRADRAIVRLKPSAFPGLPAPIRKDLEHRGCTIPQLSSNSSLAARPHNVIHGDFGQGAATDWAVLCSIDRVSAILVYWDGNPNTVAEIEKGRDWSGLVGKDEAAFDRYIAASGRDREVFVALWREFGGPEPPAIDHQGIVYGVNEKGSIILYWHDGAWLRLTGDD